MLLISILGADRITTKRIIAINIGRINVEIRPSTSIPSFITRIQTIAINAFIIKGGVSGMATTLINSEKFRITRDPK